MKATHTKRSIPCRATALFVVLAASGCYGSEDAQTADTHTNWLTCEDDVDCAELGASFACVEQVCQDTSVSDAGSSIDDELLSNLPVQLNSGVALLLSDPTQQASKPSVRWMNGRFTVAWGSTGFDIDPNSVEDNGVNLLHAVHLVDFEIETADEVVIDDQSWPSRQVIDINEQGDAIMTWGSGTCLMQVASWQTGESGYIDVCQGEEPAAATRIPGSRDWLVITGSGSDVLVGRLGFDSGLDGPLSPVGQRVAGQAFGVLANDASSGIAVWGDVVGSSVLRIGELAPPAASVPATAFLGAKPTFESFAIASMADQLISISVHEGYLWSSVLRGETASMPRTVMAADVISPRPSIVALDEHGLYAVCYVTGPGPYGGELGRTNGVSLVLLDRDGAAVLEPVEIASGIWNSGGCDVAWSGSDLMVAWWDIDIETDDYLMSVVRAMRVTPVW